MASASASDADGGDVREVRLYARVPWRERLDVWPFAIAYAILAELARRYASDTFEVALVGFTGATMHALAWLSAHWSVRAEALITCRRVDPPPRRRRDPRRADVALAHSSPPPGPPTPAPALALVFLSDGGKIKVESAPLVLEDLHDADAKTRLPRRPASPFPIAVVVSAISAAAPF